MNEKFIEDLDNEWNLCELTGKRIEYVDVPITTKKLVELFRNEGYTEKEIRKLFYRIKEDSDYTLTVIWGDDLRSDHAELTVDRKTYIL